MNHNMEMQQLMRKIAKKSLQLLEKLQQQPTAYRYPTILSESNKALLDIFIQYPEHIQHLFSTYILDAWRLLQQQLQDWQADTAHFIPDKRFRNSAWMNNPFFNVLSQHYLLASQHIDNGLKTLPDSDESYLKRLRFITRQYLDALSPDNFLQTNPEVIAETLQSHGNNLLRGLDRFLNDIDYHSHQLHISMTDARAFQIGHNIACTKGQVIFQNELMELIQYTPNTGYVKTIPLLIIPPCINKYYILDLSPNNSLVRFLVNQGIMVFIISWVNPDKRYAHKSLWDYLHEGPMTAIDIIQKQLHISEVNALGFCIGGTMLAMLLAYYEAHQQRPIRSATFLASMIDFSDTGDLSVFISEQQITALEQHLQEEGILHGTFMAQVFNSLRARDLIWAFFINNYLRAKPNPAFDLLFWNMDATNMPAKMMSEYLRGLYLNNDLIKSNTFYINNTPLDISRIEIPTFFVSTEKDHIAPWKTTYTGFQAMRGKKRFLLGGSGHIAGIIIPPGSEKYGYYWNTRTAKTPEKWLQKAHHHEGSWWPRWLSWLKKESGIRVRTPDSTQHSDTTKRAAPGHYVYVTMNGNSHADIDADSD